MNYIITSNKNYFNSIGYYNFCELKDMILPDVIAFDSETTSLDALQGEMFCCQIGTGQNNYLIDLQQHSTPLVPFNDIVFEDVIPYIKNKTLVGQNISFDLKFMYMKKFYPNKVYDTMIASKTLHNGDTSIYSHSFGDIMERELNLIYDKSEQKNINKIKLSTPKAIQYCFNDVDKLLDLHNNLYLKLKDYNAIETYELNCKFILAMSYMELCGLPINSQKWKEKMQIDLQNSLNIQKEIIEYIYDKLPNFRQNQLSLFENTKKIICLLSSVKQMIPVFKALDINVLDDEGKESIAEEVINKSKHEFVSLWLKYKEYEHRVTTFGQSILDQVKFGHIYSSFNVMVETNRMVSRKGGINFLNLPSDEITRDCFEAMKGYKMVVADYEGQENYCAAQWSKDEAMLASLIDGVDLHCSFAKVLFEEIKELSDKDIKKLHPEKRDFAKAPRFLFN